MLAINWTEVRKVRLLLFTSRRLPRPQFENKKRAPSLVWIVYGTVNCWLTCLEWLVWLHVGSHGKLFKCSFQQKTLDQGRLKSFLLHSFALLLQRSTCSNSLTEASTMHSPPNFSNSARNACFGLDSIHETIYSAVNVLSEKITFRGYAMQDPIWRKLWRSSKITFRSKR